MLYFWSFTYIRSVSRYSSFAVPSAITTPLGSLLHPIPTTPFRYAVFSNPLLPRRAMPCHSIPFHTIPYHFVPFHAMPHCTMMLICLSVHVHPVHPSHPIPSLLDSCPLYSPMLSHSNHHCSCLSILPIHVHPFPSMPIVPSTPTASCLCLPCSLLPHYLPLILCDPSSVLVVLLPNVVYRSTTACMLQKW